MKASNLFFLTLCLCLYFTSCTNGGSSTQKFSEEFKKCEKAFQLYKGEQLMEIHAKAAIGAAFSGQSVTERIPVPYDYKLKEYTIIRTFTAKDSLDVLRKIIDKSYKWDSQFKPNEFKRAEAALNKQMENNAKNKKEYVEELELMKRGETPHFWKYSQELLENEIRKRPTTIAEYDEYDIRYNYEYNEYKRLNALMELISNKELYYETKGGQEYKRLNAMPTDEALAYEVSVTYEITEDNDYIPQGVYTEIFFVDKSFQKPIKMD